jgi:peptide/nickel transport system ATP-binding protein
VMYTGKIIEESSVGELFENPKHPYTQGLLRSVPKLTSVGAERHHRLQTIEGVVPSPTELPTGCHFEPRCEFARNECRLGEIPLVELTEDVRVRCVLFNEEIISNENEQRGLPATTG